MEKRPTWLIVLIWLALVPLIVLAGLIAFTTVCFATAAIVPKGRDEVALNGLLMMGAGGLAAALVVGGLIWLAVVGMRKWNNKG